jgi:hypothetical protein
VRSRLLMFAVPISTQAVQGCIHKAYVHMTGSSNAWIRLVLPNVTARCLLAAL